MITGARHAEAMLARLSTAVWDLESIAKNGDLWEYTEGHLLPPRLAEVVNVLC